MSTGADLLGLLELLDNELETGSGEVDEARSLIALQQGQHYFELAAASTPKVLQSTVDILTVATTEKTTWATTLRRLDALWYLDTNGNPIRKLKRISEIGGHVPSLPWPLQVTLSPGPEGAPFGYYGNMANFYWLPRPDAAYSIRVYGFVKQAVLALRTTAFSYPDETQLAIATFASKLLAQGVDDATIDIDRLTAQLFRPLLRSYRHFDRSEPTSRYYTEWHST